MRILGIALRLRDREAERRRGCAQPGVVGRERHPLTLLLEEAQ